MARVLVVTNDFPPRVGGIQQYIHNVVNALVVKGGHEVTVLAPDWPHADVWDGAQPCHVVRYRGPVIATFAVQRVAEALIASRGIEVVVFGAALPLVALTSPLVHATGVRCIALSHGVEVAAGSLPGARALLREAGRDLWAMTAISVWSAARMRRLIAQRCPVVLLGGGVDVERYAAPAGGEEIRARYGFGASPVCVCVARLVARKGQDQLIAAWPQVRAHVKDAQLLIVGGGREARRLRRLRERSPAGSSITFSGEVPWEQLPAYYQAGDVFAMPCRTRWLGLDVEALGLSFLEAGASGLPVVVGRSGGAEETVLDGRTGYLVDGRRPADIATAVGGLLGDLPLARAMGAAGRAWIRETASWDVATSRFDEVVRDAAAGRRR